MKLTHDQRVLLKREADLIRQAYENDPHGDRTVLKQRYDEIDQMLRGDCQDPAQAMN